MRFCTREHITDLLLAAYVAKCEEMNPGIVDRAIDDVSREIASMLAARYPQPWPHIPEIIRYCAAVVAAYRVVEAITSLVATEAPNDNEWIPLQKQWKYCTNILDDLAKSRTRLDLEATDEREDATVAVVTPPKHFDFRGFS